MANPKVIEKQPIDFATLKSEFNKIKKRDEELNFRMSRMQEFLEKAIMLNKTKTKKLYDELIALEIPRLKEHMIYKIINLLPKTVEELKIIFQGSPISISKSNLEKIAKTIKTNL